jgi:alkylhydroperoxidase/carboxymuconolactone decarboxylase family protein YurZ
MDPSSTNDKSIKEMFVKQENPDRIAEAKSLLVELKELRGGSVTEMHRRIANDPQLLGAFTRQYLNCNKTGIGIPRKFRELIFMAIGCARGTPETVLTHGHLAKEHGATVEEIGEVLRIVFLVCGVSGVTLGARLFDEFPDV